MTIQTMARVTAYMTDEQLHRDHWRAAELSAADPAPVSDVCRPALLVVCGSPDDVDAARQAIEASAMQRLGPAVRGGALVAATEAAERMQAAAYDLPLGALRTRLLADSVVVLQELARLVASLA
jgi:hypothetical protein